MVPERECGVWGEKAEVCAFWFDHEIRVLGLELGSRVQGLGSGFLVGG